MRVIWIVLTIAFITACGGGGGGSSSGDNRDNGLPSGIMKEFPSIYILYPAPDEALKSSFTKVTAMFKRELDSEEVDSYFRALFGAGFSSSSRYTYTKDSALFRHSHYQFTGEAAKVSTFEWEISALMGFPSRPVEYVLSNFPSLNTNDYGPLRAYSLDVNFVDLDPQSVAEYTDELFAAGFKRKDSGEICKYAGGTDYCFYGGGQTYGWAVYFD